MGYRNYVGTIPTEIYEADKDLTKDELKAKYGEDFWNHRDSEHMKELHNFGKYCDFGIQDDIEEFYTKFKEGYDDCEFHVITKEGYLKIIEWYRLQILNFYKELLAKDEEAKDADLSSKIREWEGRFGEPYNLDEERKEIVSSWKYEYAVFELVIVLKSFDWENNVMVWYGY
ncbi:MAG: hypothetical protein P8J32_00320 [bacterium]|nr:hypothetical protein [bacterium]